MKILNRETGQEITNPDLAAGYLQEGKWASPEAYASVDNVTKFALDDGDYEQVQFYHAYTPDEIAQREQTEAKAAHQELIDALPDAVADLSVMVSDNSIDTADLQDAIAELSEIVSGLME